MGKLKVNADINSNRLYLSFSGKISQEEMEEFYTDVRFCVADLKEGFDAISDYSDCELINLNCIPALKKIMSYLIENGLGKIVRVLQSDKIAHKQILNLASRVQGYQPIYVTTPGEAEEQLKNTVDRKGLRVHLHNKNIEYVVGDKKGKGSIVDISTSGCAVEFNTLNPVADDEISLKISFVSDNNVEKSLEIKARVIRVRDNIFAAEFINFDNEDKQQLWNCLLCESRR